jgi:hypothetical protein
MDWERLDPASPYGLMAEFDSAEAVVRAAHRTWLAGYRKMDAYTPYPVEGLSEEMGFHRSHVSTLVFIGGVVGLLSGYLMLYYLSAVDYPLDIGGRPLNSVPAWIPILFEMTVLFASLAAVFGMFALNGLPLPYHPVFNVPEFARASKDHFFLCIESTDSKFESQATRKFLQGLGPLGVYEVPL